MRMKTQPIVPGMQNPTEWLYLGAALTSLSKRKWQHESRLKLAEGWAMDKKCWEGSLGHKNCPLQSAACPTQCPGADQAAGESPCHLRKCPAEHPGWAAAQKISHESSGSAREKWELVIELALILTPSAEAGKSSRGLPTSLSQQRPVSLGAGDSGNGAGAVLEDLSPPLSWLRTCSVCEAR